MLELEIPVPSLPRFIAYISAMTGFPLRIKQLVLLWLACLVYMASKFLISRFVFVTCNDS